MVRNPAGRAPGILIIDDKPGIRRILEILFRTEGFRVASAADGANLEKQLGEFEPDVVVTDVRMEPVSGIDVLRQARMLRPGIPVILMTAYGTIAAAVEAMKLGAVDFITKPFRNEDLVRRVQRALEARAAHSMGTPAPAAPSGGSARAPVASSAALRTVMGQVEKIASSRLTVLITGETGTGKSMIAQELHRRGPWAGGPFVAINAAALPEPLLESELFGHEKGAFTGATAARAGLFEAAEGGTIFLDEIGALPANLQSKLLGVLQERQVRRVGGNRTVSIDARFIAATNTDLEQAVKRGEFRQDLYYRLNVARIRMPPLREHREDIPDLLRELLDELSAGRPFRYTISAETMGLLTRYPFPGNVRELRNAIEWAVAVSRSDVIEPADLPEVMRLGDPDHPDSAAAPGGSLAEMERGQIERAVGQLGGNLAEVARNLGISRTTLWRKMRDYGLKK